MRILQLLMVRKYLSTLKETAGVYFSPLLCFLPNNGILTQNTISAFKRYKVQYKVSRNRLYSDQHFITNETISTSL